MIKLAAVTVVFWLIAGPVVGQSVPEFRDVPEGHFAEDAIEWAAANGITMGVGNNRFGIGQTLTRYEMVTFLCRAFDSAGCGVGTRGSERFADVPVGHWADYSVGWAVARGITVGVSAAGFGGSRTLTREEMITFLYRASGSPTGGGLGSDVFGDVPNDSSEWANLPIGWAFEHGITSGVADGVFGFGTTLSREEMVLFLCRAVAPSVCVPSRAAADAQFFSAVTNLVSGVEQATGVWDGFNPGGYSTVVIFRTDGEVSHLLAINHTNPTGLGTPTPVDNTGTPFGSLHRIDDVDPTAAKALAAVEYWDGRVTVGGMEAFVIVADPTDDLNATQLDWVAFFMHELFHRYQHDTFTGPVVEQDVENYPYTAANIELAVLEERALHAALTATSVDERLVATRRFAGLRLARLAAEPRVALDNRQERKEGTARYLEHRFAGDDTRYIFHDTNYHRDLQTHLRGDMVKRIFGFGRFYASGAAVMRILDLMGVQHAQAAIQRGQSPAEVLIDHLGITEHDTADLVAAATQAYDPAGELKAMAEQAAQTAKTEPPIFGDRIRHTPNTRRRRKLAKAGRQASHMSYQRTPTGNQTHSRSRIGHQRLPGS